MTRTAGIYARISRDRVGAGLGVERQEKDCRALAEALDWSVSDVYVDNDISAFSGRSRPDYERLLGDVENGRLDAVISWHCDRLHRSPIELERYITICDARGVPTHAVKAGALDLSTASGRMTARITDAVARHESEQKGERVRRQKQQAQADGKWLGGRRPFGFEPDAVTLRTREADAIADATRRILAGDSMRAIVTEWNKAELTTTSGLAWDVSKLGQMLRRPRNAGLTGNLRRIIGEAAWPAIVERETWEALVAKLEDPARRTNPGGTSRKLIGSYLYFCECGERVRSGGQRKDGASRYTCSANHLRRVSDPIDKLVLDVICGVLVRDGVQLIPPTQDVTPIRDRLAVVRARGAEIASMLGDVDAAMSAEQFRVANAKVQHEIRELEAEIGRRSAGSSLVGIADAPDPGGAFRAADIDRQRAIIDALATVTVLRVRHGRQPNGNYFSPDSVRIEPKAEAGLVS
jgi:DNA invertase Pin-like site-specific DNA recombinase